MIFHYCRVFPVKTVELRSTNPATPGGGWGLGVGAAPRLRVLVQWAVGNDVPPEGCLTVAMSFLQEAETIIQKIKQQQYADLLSHDQLLMERKEQKVFLHFGKN